VVAVLVPGLVWLEDRDGGFYCLPAETVVPAEVALASGQATYAQLVLPRGSLDLAEDRYPLRPRAVDTLPPQAAVEVPWQPERPPHGVVDLGQDWRLLLRELEAFVPWGAPLRAFAAAMDTYRRRSPPRPGFRASPDRRRLGYLYPQLVAAEVCYRLGSGFREMGGRHRFAAIAVEDELTLHGPGGWTAVAGRDALGWRLALRREGEEPRTARRLPDAVALLASAGVVWRAGRPVRRGLLGAGGMLLRP
jgi:hypothetical protein